MGHPRPLVVYFRLFKQTYQFFQQQKCEKCPSSIWCWDSNPRPSERESLPITTRAGLPPYNFIYYFLQRAEPTTVQDVRQDQEG